MWARKYRPKTFEEVVGQDDAVKILKESEDRVNTFILSGPSGVGKAQPLTSKILTPDGYIAMRDVSIGNKVIDGDGFITTVIGVYPQGTRDVYKITLNDRTSYEVSDEHLNVVEYWNPNRKLMIKEVLTTTELIEAIKHKSRVYRIPVPVLNSWEERAVPIDPYLLGALIGDGSLANGQKFSNSEVDVIDNVKHKLEEIGHTLKWTSRYDYTFSRIDSSFPYLVHTIRHMGLNVKSSQKHIPKEYLYNSYNVRLRLFQGLFDTDGTIEHGVPTFNTSSQQLSEDMAFLARSLGMRVTVSCSMGAYTQNGIKIKTIPSYQLTMKINNGVQFYTSLKHSSRYKRRQTDVIRKIVSVEFVGKKECQCIMVESGAHTYITDNVTVTHNTTLARIYGEYIDSEIIEINGADNNGVDDVRGLTTMATYSPSFNKHRMFIIDECFKGDSLVTMSDFSKKYIKDVTIGDNVQSMTGCGVVTNVFVNKVELDRLTLVKLSDGVEILTTNDHLFFTRYGWVEASKLAKGDVLYDEGKNMCNMQQNIYDKMGCKNVLKGVQAPTAINIRGNNNEFVGVHETQGTKFNEDEVMQPNVIGCNNPDNDRHQEKKRNTKPSSTGAWWKWIYNSSTATALRQLAKWVYYGISHKDHEEAERWVPARIQSRPSLSREKVGDRGGWQFPQIEKNYGKRLKEDPTARGVRVESVEVYKSSDKRECFMRHLRNTDISLGFVDMYDLEVSNHPSYFVEGVLVHNCHSLTAQAWNALLKVLEESPKSTVWVLCTTEPSKIPSTIHSRAVVIRLKRVKSSLIKDLILSIMEKEGYILGRYDNEVMSNIITRSNGRVREALTAAETYLTTGVEPSGMNTLDVIKYITGVYNDNIELVNRYHSNLDNEDVKLITLFISSYISFLLLNSKLKGTMTPQNILATYTSIDPFYLDDLRVMQTAVYTSSKVSKEPVADTISTLYNYYDKILAHYNDFRDSTESFKIATLAYMSELRDRG